ncbi:negative elongation factor A [Puma concolor]|uniref:Negative elongation factor A n=1 Tax=Puma concolor TaxID=9696 RepID=A0A6P6HNH5_PUMCO|nr:negative elongation factor A [Puma concolor]
MEAVAVEAGHFPTELQWGVKGAAMKGALAEIIQLATLDSDPWVLMVADILKSFPDTGSLNLDLEEQNPNVQDILGELREKGFSLSSDSWGDREATRVLLLRARIQQKPEETTDRGPWRLQREAYGDHRLAFPIARVNECEASAMLPLECQYLNKNALTTLAGPLTPPVKHFQLKRKPKSATLRAELLQKSPTEPSRENLVPSSYFCVCEEKRHARFA